MSLQRRVNYAWEFVKEFNKKSGIWILIIGIILAFLNYYLFCEEFNVNSKGVKYAPAETYFLRGITVIFSTFGELTVFGIISLIYSINGFWISISLTIGMSGNYYLFSNSFYITSEGKKLDIGETYFLRICSSLILLLFEYLSITGCLNLMNHIKNSFIETRNEIDAVNLELGNKDH